MSRLSLARIADTGRRRRARRCGSVLATVPVFGRILLPPFFFSTPIDVGSQI